MSFPVRPTTFTFAFLIHLRYQLMGFESTAFGKNFIVLHKTIETKHCSLRRSLFQMKINEIKIKPRCHCIPFISHIQIIYIVLYLLNKRKSLTVDLDGTFRGEKKRRRDEEEKIHIYVYPKNRWQRFSNKTRENVEAGMGGTRRSNGKGTKRSTFIPFPSPPSNQ